nr:unnamed protein product [Callosobruchus chinensis]
MARRSRQRGSDRKKPKLRKFKVYKAGKISVNPFLNFVRDVRKISTGISVCKIVRKAARLWRRMNDEEKQPYKQMAKKARDQQSVPKDRKRRDSDTSLSGSCTDMRLSRCSSQKDISSRTAGSTRSLNRSKSRSGV